MSACLKTYNEEEKIWHFENVYPFDLPQLAFRTSKHGLNMGNVDCVCFELSSEK